MNKRHAQKASKALGATHPLGTVHLIVFVPSVDRDGKKLRGTDWTRATLDLLGRLFRGATAFPRGLGVWRDDAAGGRLVYDDTTIVFSYVDPAAFTDEALDHLRGFLHRMGRQARQGEVGLVLDGHYIGIDRFQEA